MKTKKALVIDDENKTRELIAKMLRSFNLDIEVIAKGNSVTSGIKAIQEYQPDIVFLDIQLVDGTGFDILQKIPVKNFEVIFVTAHEDFAIKAIKFSALDYILKPVDVQELREATENAIRVHGKRRDSIQFDTLQHNISEYKKRRLVLKTFESLHVVNIEDIIRCESDRNYTSFHLVNDRKILVSKTLKEFETLLKDQNFLRVQQSHLINLNFVERYDKADGGAVIMVDGSSVPISIAKRDAFFQILGKM